MRKQLVKTFFSALKENTIPWQRDWKETEIPRNALSGKEYRGLNVLWLQYVSQEKGYADPRWCTSRQAREKGWKIKEGETGTRIEYYSLFDKGQNRNISFQEAEQLQQKISPEEYQERIYGIIKDSAVFNAEQLEDIPIIEKRGISFPAEELLKQRDAILDRLGLEFEEGGDKARYNYYEDKIRMPPLEHFRDAYGYMSTFLHEVGHATGHKKRLCRDLPAPGGYAREELRAEITSAFVGQELNLPMTEEHINNHKAYIQDWLQVLEKDPYELIDAIMDAEVAADYILEKFDLSSKRTDIERVRGESEEALDLHEKYHGIMEKQADSDSQNAVREVGKNKILGLYEWRGRNGCVHYMDQDGRHCLTDGMTLLEDVDISVMNAFDGLTKTRGIDADLFAEKLLMYHPEVEFSESQLRRIDKKAGKRSNAPPEDKGIMSYYAKVSKKLAGMISSRNPDVSLYQNVEGKMEKTEGSLQESGTFSFVNKKEFDQRKNFYPTITCTQSENPAFMENMIYAVSEFDDLVKGANIEFNKKKKDVKERHGSHWSVFKHGSKEEVHYLGYEKIRFTIDSKQGQDVIHRPDQQDIGDGEESMLEYLSAFPSNDAEVQGLKRQTTIEKGMEKKRIFPNVLKSKRMAGKNLRRRGRRL